MNSVSMVIQTLGGISKGERSDSKEELVNAKIEIANLILANAQQRHAAGSLVRA